ncbi:hypothetical protein HPB49_002650 [Dermacentor silvarum]|uniref:Uncharacterized protein n=1 Tax=Dermacentor silvarum TaxID=543639 RepID=A0ACB8C6Y1_DERSI|nr:hypothetical protein HPB49_002650 [Dermacentor silvarum]
MASASSTAFKPVVSPDARTTACPVKSALSDEIKVETESDGEGRGGGRECATPEGDGKTQHRHQQGRSDSFGRPERPSLRSDPPRQLSSAEQRIAATIRQHYYPEGGWGWVVCVCVCLVNALSWGMQLNYGVMHAAAIQQFGEEHAGEAPTHSPASPLGTYSVMDPELRAHANLPAVLINRQGLYVIIAVLGVSILGCACVLTYSFTNYSRLKRNAEEVRNYIAASPGGVKVAADKMSGGRDQAAVGGVIMGDARSSAVAALAVVAAGNESSVGLATQRGAAGNKSDVSLGERSAGTSPVLVRQDASGTATAAQRPGAVQGASFIGHTPAAVAMAASATTSAVVPNWSPLPSCDVAPKVVLETTDFADAAIVFEASSPFHSAPTRSPAPPAGICNAMDPKLRAYINLPVLLINREGLYVIIAVLGVSILGRASFISFINSFNSFNSFINYSRLKRNAEEVRHYIAASSGGAISVR